MTQATEVGYVHAFFVDSFLDPQWLTARKACSGDSKTLKKVSPQDIFY